MDNTSGIASYLPSELAGGIFSFINIIRALGIVALFYIVFNLINLFFNRRKEKQLKEIKEDIHAIRKSLEHKSKKKNIKGK